VRAPLLVATDVDGTLLNPADRVTARTARVLARLVPRGVGLVLVTGRPPRWLAPVLAQVGVAGLTVCANGAVVYDAATGEVISAHTLDAATLADVAAAVSDVLPNAGLAVERIGLSGEHFMAEPSYRHAWVGSDHTLRSRSELVEMPAVKMLVRDPALTSDAMVAALAPVIGCAGDLTFSHAGGLVEVSAPGVTKATGLAEVAATLGVSAADVIAFGDMPNDLEMLRWAGHGVAMGNAHPALREVADEITATNAEDGLALVLERWF
jgi:hydroxymethylpyrimidine pyrophosphatase-like HAD family hydrolase